MVGRLVQKVQVRLGDCGAGQKGGALPAAGEGGEFTFVQFGGGAEGFEQEVDAPLVGVALSGGEGAADGFVEGEVQEVCGHVLFDEGQAQAAAAGDVAAGGFGLAGEAAQQGGFAAAVGGDQADAVVGVDGQVEAGEEGARGGDGQGAQAEDQIFDQGSVVLGETGKHGAWAAKSEGILRIVSWGCLMACWIPHRDADTACPVWVWMRR